MAYKTFANGFPLPASDLNNYLMNQSVIVFADSTARTAALTTPTEGMVTYLEDTNLLEVYNGSAWADINDNTAAIPKSTVTTAGDLIVADGASSVTRLGAGSDGSLLTVDSGSPAYLAPGTDDQVLTVVSGEPAWADAGGGGGGITLLSTTTISTSTTLITGISTDYKDLLVTGENLTVSSTILPFFYPKSSSGGIDRKNIYPNSGNSTVSDWKIGSTPYFTENTWVTGNFGNFEIRFPNYTSGSTKSWSFSGCNTRGTPFIGGGGTNLAATQIAIDQFELRNITGGTIKIYGVL